MMSDQRFSPAEYIRFHAMAPQVELPNAKLWYARGQTFVIAYVDAAASAEITREAQPDEYVVLQPDTTSSVEVEWNGETTRIPGGSIAFVPAGRSVVRAASPGRLVLMYTTRSIDLCEKCVNADAYAEAHPHIPPFEPWPEALGAAAVRHYSIDVPDEPERFGRIWRCSTFMVNLLPPHVGPRDITKLSPHHHDSFEQGSLALDGGFTHHVRWPWTSNMNAWRPDEHEYCGSPSFTVIPPQATHTSRAMDAGINQLVDIFSPPRHDFSHKRGWVLNAADYPLPEHINDQHFPG
ncbi:hypothetical protein [Pandoraea bronchicola]|nr:hypothetical protein [Pandoraea bronchicola]